MEATGCRLTIRADTWLGRSEKDENRRMSNLLISWPVVKASLLWQYGLEGRDYTLDAKGNPLVKKEVLELRNKDLKAAKELGFEKQGMAGEAIGSTDINRLGDSAKCSMGMLFHRSKCDR